MHHRILSILRRLKQDPTRELGRPAILDICRQGELVSRGNWGGD